MMECLMLLPLLVYPSLAGNILVYNPTFGHSHVRFLGNIADLLAEDGHNVTVLTNVQDESIPPFGCKHPSIHKILFKSPYLPENEISDISVKSNEFWSQPPPNGRAMEAKDLERFAVSGFAAYKGLLESKDLIESLRQSKFDLGVAELNSLFNVGIFELVGIKTSMAGAALGTVAHQSDLLGLPYFPSFIPVWITSYNEKMSFFERLENFKAVLEGKIAHYMDWKNCNKMFQEYYPGFPDTFELMKKQVGVVLSNVNEFTESPRPSTNMIQYVGGANVHPSKPLSKKLDALLSQRPSNVLFSLGTFVKSCMMPPHLKQGMVVQKQILSTFSSFPEVTFLWKYEKCQNDTVDFSLHPNVVPMEWVPQSDLLGDPRLTAFVTHAGMNSMIEVSFRGKPTVTIPLFADQYINAKNAVNRGLTVMLERYLLSKETLSTALKKVLDPNSEVAQTALMAADVLKGKDEEYRNAVKHWANLLIKHGKLEHLRLPAGDLSLFQLYCLDCALFVVFIGFSVLFGIVVTAVLLRRLWRKLSLLVKEKTL